MLDFRQLESACNEAEVRRLTDPLSLHDWSNATHTVAAAIRRDHGLPIPEVNAEIAPGDRTYFADFLWLESRLIAELDSRTFHLTPRAFEADRERDRGLAVAGLRVIRLTWRQLHREPQRLAADLHALLTAQPPNRRS